jgi:hypothetical protein
MFQLKTLLGCTITAATIVLVETNSLSIVDGINGVGKVRRIVFFVCWGKQTGFQSSGRIWRSTFAGCRDYWAAILFVVHFWAVIGVCIYLGVTGIQKTNHNNAIRARDSVHASVNSFNSTLSPSPAPTPLPASSYSIGDWAPQLATAAGAAVIFAWIWQFLIRMFPQTMIYTCLIMGSIATGTT